MLPYALTLRSAPPMIRNNRASLPVSGDLTARAELCRLDAGDMSDLLALERQCFTCPWNEKQFSLALDQQVFSIVGLKASGRLLAYASFYHVADEMEILNIGVETGLRKQGLARRLLGFVLQLARKMGIGRVLLEVRAGNIAARTLYAGFGFAQVGLRKGYYPDNGEDALVMSLELCPEPGERTASPIATARVETDKRGGQA